MDGPGSIKKSTDGHGLDLGIPWPSLLQDINLEMDNNTVDNQGHRTLYLEAVDDCTENFLFFFTMIPSHLHRFIHSIGRTPFFLLLLRKDKWKVIKILVKKHTESRLLTIAIRSAGVWRRF